MWSAIGHDSAILALTRSLEQGRMAHAYLFLGPPGVGKTHLALNLAQALNCTATEGHNVSSQPCGECSQCRRIMAGKHADVQVIGLPKDKDGALGKLVSIEQVRDLQAQAGLQPFEGRSRVFIFERADLLSPDAANALLKTLEEPPPTVCLILLAADERAILPTVLSRCQSIRLRPVPGDRIAELLASRHGVEPERARFLARIAGGSPGWALRAAQDEDVVEARAARVDQVIETFAMPHPERLTLAGKLAEEFSKSRDAVYGWLVLLRQCWRDALLIKAGQRESVVNGDRMAVLETVAEAVSLADMAGALRHAEATSQQLEKNANPRLALDILMLNLPIVAEAAARTEGQAVERTQR